MTVKQATKEVPAGATVKGGARVEAAGAGSAIGGRSGRGMVSSTRRSSSPRHLDTGL